MAGEPYNEQQGLDFQANEVKRAYEDAGHDLDLANVVWSNRMTCDAVTTLGYAASRKKHERILRGELGLDPGFVAASRTWNGDFCGVRVAGLPFVEGASTHAPDMVLSWFLDRYPREWWPAIFEAWHQKNYTHFVLSWPDSRSQGMSPDDFVAMCKAVIRAGFFPCVMLLSKTFDPAHNVPELKRRIDEILPLLIDVVPMICIGWELSFYLDGAELQQLIDYVCPQLRSDCLRYVHFQPGFTHLPFPGVPNTAAWWRLQVGKLTGVLHQRIPGTSDHAYLFDSGGLVDALTRAAGNFGNPTDSGFGHPFDIVAFEGGASEVFSGGISAQQAAHIGDVALACPPQMGPAGTVGIMGVGNGHS